MRFVPCYIITILLSVKSITICNLIIERPVNLISSRFIIQARNYNCKQKLNFSLLNRPYCGGFILILLCALISSNESASTSSALLSGIRKMRPRFFQRQFQFGKRTLNQRKKASWKDKRTSVFKSIFSPSQSTRRQFPITKRIINLSDPLHGILSI